MQKSPKGSFAKYLMAGTGLAMLAMSGTAYAQQAAPAAQDDIETVVVVGARAAQQSSNDRKKRAKTATDSIVADDVGAFPDRNLNEAISRIAGVALSRDDFGEGTQITIRGNSAENVRVELDGLGVGGGGLDLTRSADLTSLPSDLIKSVDVVKGSTADMTEGSLGGSVKIQTRTGLDFKKPYLSFRVGTRRNSLGESWRPEYNFVASRKFLDNRLGVILNVSGSNFQNIANSVGVNASGAGYQGRIDFDDSPEKTFSFNPTTVDDNNPASDTRLTNSSFTPRQIVTMSAAAKSKAECYAAFPLLTATSGANANSRNQRVYELQTCLGQWNDLEPQNVRSFDNTQTEDRFTVDLRFDYRVNDNLTVFAKFNKNERKVDRYYRNRSLSGGLQQPFNPGAIYNGTTNPTGVWNVDTTTSATKPYATRLLAPGNTKYFLYDDTVGVYNNLPIIGDVVAIDPTSVKVDANHFVTEYVINDATMGLQQRWEPFTWDTTFAQFGGEYRKDGLRVEFMAGKSKTDYSRVSAFSTRGFTYGSARMYVQPSGLWAYDILSDYDETDPANYAQLTTQAARAEQIGAVDLPYLPALAANLRPRVSLNPMALQYDPYLSETAETTAKLDATYDFRGSIPFITTFKMGASYRNPEGSFWSRPGGMTIQSGQGTYYNMRPDPNYTGTGTAPLIPVRDANNRPVRNPNYVAPIILPRSFVRSTVRACEPTAMSTESCDYGYVPTTLWANKLDGTLTLTQEQMIQLLGSTVTRPDSNFFNDYEGADGLTNWMGIDTKALVGLLPTANFDCVKTCVASDGKTYEQPYRSYSEKITAAYYVAEFEQELPLGLMFDGNVGLRVVETEVTGRGTLQIDYIRTNGSFNSADPTNANGIQTLTLNQNVDLTKTTRDYLPSYNFNLWVIPDKLVFRYYKGKNVARPAIADLLPAATCSIDERRTMDLDEFGEENTCGRIGNPALKPFTAWNQNLSVEWYPNKDTMFSLARHTQDERIGRRVGITQTGNLLEGVGLTDPNTGQPVDDVLFSYPTWGNAPGYKREGWEFTSKTAFTFLPWYFRYTGADFNYSKMESTQIGANASYIVNPNTGEVMPPQEESEYFMNLSLWYDDGKTNARISYQGRAEYFVNIEGNSGNVRNNYPFPGGTNTRPTPYRPGNAIYRDETKYIDAKITHKLRPEVELFAEVRNLTKQGRIESAGGSLSFADGTPYVDQLDYGGRHFTFGITYRPQ